MNNYFKGLLVAVLTFALGFTSVNATTTKAINKNTCDTIYTNYYFLIDANVESYFGNGSNISISRTDTGSYTNNQYRTDFDSSNVGYGQVTVDKYSATSGDGITSMSLNDYYTILLAGLGSNGTYKDGNKTYMVSHSWIMSSASDAASKAFSFKNYSVSQLVNATLDAKTNITRSSDIKYTQANPFTLTISRNYYGSVTGKPLVQSTNKWYIHPAVYYVQYCASHIEKYNINYFGNGGSDYVTNVPSTQTSEDGSCLFISNKVPVRENYTFIGWNTKADGTGKTYAAGTKYCGDSDLNLYAIWERNVENTYTVKYKENTSDTVTNMPSTQTVNTKNDTTISALIPIRSGYKFLGWSTDSNSTKGDVTYNPGKDYTKRKDLVLYAIWEKEPEGTYTVKYVENTTDVVSNMPSTQTVSNDKDTNISTLIPVRNGYTFVGWSTDPNATTPNYSLGSLYTDRKDLVLYAIWSKNEVLPENPKTAVSTYVIPFSAVAAAGLVGLRLTRRNDLFRQF